MIRSATILKSTALFCAFSLLAACSGGDDKTPETPLSGERISVLSFKKNLEADPTLADDPVILPQPYKNLNWTQSGGSASNAMHHLSLGDAPQRLWRRSIGRGSSGKYRLVTAPIVVDGILYAIDSKATVSALDAATGREIWKRSFKVKKEGNKIAFGGGVAYGEGKIFATNGYGMMLALDAETGTELWRYEATIPFRGAPAYSEGRVFGVTHDNQLIALAAEDGVELWTHIGIVEVAGILGSAAPAVGGGTVLAAYSSGELFALRVENGRVAWTDTLSRTGRLTALATLNDIDGDPIVDRGTVYAVSHAGRMVAIDYTSGNRIWEQDVAAIATPWIAGEYIFMVSVDNELLAIQRRDGRIRWSTQLQRFTDPEDREGVITWSGPILASDRLLLTSSHGYLISVSPYSGEVLSGVRLSEGTHMPPILANETLYVLSDDGDVTAYR
ncbi:MAG: PQQ-binding-like beta-propeller repeat protein [Sphingomonadales bacterium]|jgi:outer membrane protein assembly factor BamB